VLIARSIAPNAPPGYLISWFGALPRLFTMTDSAKKQEIQIDSSRQEFMVMCFIFLILLLVIFTDLRALFSAALVRYRLHWYYVLFIGFGLLVIWSYQGFVRFIMSAFVLSMVIKSAVALLWPSLESSIGLGVVLRVIDLAGLFAAVYWYFVQAKRIIRYVKTP
jgi:hypothetical protein